MKRTARVVRYARKLGEVFSEFRLGSLASSFVCGRVDQALKMSLPSVSLYTGALIARR